MLTNKKNKFYKIILDYGFEDDDLINRLKLFGKKPRYISNRKFLKVLYHEDKARIENEYNFNEVIQIFYKKINHFSTDPIARIYGTNQRYRVNPR